MQQSSAASPEPRAGFIERLAFRRVPLWSVALIVAGGATLTIAYGAIMLNPERHGALGQAAEALAEVPDTLGRMAGGLLPYRPSIGGNYERLPGGLWRNPAQPFVDPGYVLVTDFDTGHARRVVRLVRLSDGRVMREYEPDIEAVHRKSTFKSALADLGRDKTNRFYFPMHPLLMPDGGLLIHDTSPLVRIDACGKPIWMIDGIFHHSVERGPDGDYWAAYRVPQSRLPDVGPDFIEEGIAHVNAAGAVLSRTSIVDILDQNGLGHLWRGRPFNEDPFHLNDIQPVMSSGPYWQRGDLLVSLRNLSMVMLYRPSTGKVLWRKTFPWKFQHDVNVIDDHRISVFDNHWRFAFDQPEQAEVDGTNRVVVYDFATDSTSDPLTPSFHKLGIRTRAQGRATPLANGDTMVEETEQGRLLRIAPDGTVRWRYISADGDRRRYALRWSRYLDPVADGDGIKAAVDAKCS
ncbi:arylsulfotransferase family protein [Sphingomonas sp.]|uniref:arylsulfotransferase family protein n=1 Tax=Sphingomonas sp. TaxID=28214 RepID=UPI001B1BD315|nr:arylsulfotransferase family protein [Sphingomonas sp.]MBO9713613.1 aryl-sulfate sulfotransferase [Sphingomonas sp.]